MEETRLGRIEISPTAIAALASQAVLQSYGVVGMASKSLMGELLKRNGKRGVEVKLVDDEIIINLYVVIEYGTRICEVAHNIMRGVKFNVEKALGVPISEVNVYVQGLRVSCE
jgi:uncharacterized alkaline shock family protein YloU